MNRVPVVSSTIASVGYDEESSTLEIEFRDGGIYQYFDVPQAEHQAMMGGGSVGVYFSAAIRGVYRYARS